MTPRSITEYEYNYEGCPKTYRNYTRIIDHKQCSSKNHGFDSWFFIGQRSLVEIRLCPAFVEVWLGEWWKLYKQSLGTHGSYGS